MIRSVVRSLPVLALLLSIVPVALADQAVKQGPWVLHYMTMNTTELTPEVAHGYGVTRSKTRGLLMLNLQRADAPLESIDHRSEGTIRNLIGQSRAEAPRHVEANGAIYTLVEYRYSHLETLRFDFAIYPEGDAGAPVRLNFNQQMFTPGQ